MPSVDVDVRISGPLFRAAQRAGVMNEFTRDAVDDVTAQVYADVMTNLDGSIQHPTPYYETQIYNQRLSPTLRRVHDRGIVYGPWLELGSRDGRRFRGYASFRRARQSVQARVPQLIQHALARCIARLGG